VVWQRVAIRHGGKFIKHVVPAVIKPIHSLWNEVIGFFFLCFAAVFGFRTYSYYRSYVQAPPGAAFNELMRVVVTAFFGVVMAVFGISSFLRARRISRS
jgi:Ca2+/Na+ antiporter